MTWQLGTPGACKAIGALILHGPGAGVVELVDASDSKSEAPCECGGSSPPSGTIIIGVFQDNLIAFHPE